MRPCSFTSSEFLGSFVGTTLVDFGSDRLLLSLVDISAPPPVSDI